MAFSVTYGSVLDRNINHLYTTREKTKIKQIQRNKLYRSELLDLEMQAKERQKRKTTTRRRSNMEFVPEFDIEIPRAPAFRVADKAHIDEMIKRLSRRPKVKSDPRGCQRYQRGFPEYEWEEDDLVESPRSTVSPRRMHSILNRLTKQHSTCGRRHPSPVPREEDYLPNFTI